MFGGDAEAQKAVPDAFTVQTLERDTGALFFRIFILKWVDIGPVHCYFFELKLSCILENE
jgi:hypothetical protein